jgi:hypothetical protein
MVGIFRPRCASCGASMPLNPKDGTAQQLRDLDQWMAEHRRTCPRPPAKFVVPKAPL